MYQDYTVNFNNKHVRDAATRAESLTGDWTQDRVTLVDRCLTTAYYNVQGSTEQHRVTLWIDRAHVHCACSCRATSICLHAMAAYTYFAPKRRLNTVTIDNSREAIMGRGRIADEQLFGSCGEWAIHADDYAESRLMVAAVNGPISSRCGICGAEAGCCNH